MPRSVSSQWGALNAGEVKERRFFVRIEPNPGTAADDIYLLSHGDISITPAGTVSDARIRQLTSASQKLNPDQGAATIGSVSVEVEDVGNDFRDLVRAALLTDGDGLRNKRIEIWNGFKDLADTEYVLEDTQVIQEVKHTSGHKWTINARDIQREMRKTILEPVSMRLLQPLSATATTIEVDNATVLEAVEHGTGWSDGASGTHAYVKIDDEIIRVPAAGIGTTQLTNCVRGRLGTRAAEHTTDETASDARGKQVTEVIYLELPVPKLAYALLTGVLFNQSGTLPDHWHLGIDPSNYVRTSEFQNIGSDLYVFSDDTLGQRERYILDDGVDGKKFIEQEILRKYALFMPVHSNGELGLRRGQPVLSGSATSGLISDREIIGDVTLRYDMTKIINDIEIQWNYLGGNPTRKLRIQDTASINKWGATQPFQISARGLVGSIHTDSRVRDLYESLRDRYSGPPILTSVTCQMSANLYEVGDVIRLQTTHLQDFTNEFATYIDRAFEVQGVRKDHMRGRVVYDLFGSTQRAGPLPPLESTTPLPDSYYTAAGTDLSTLPGVVDGGSELTLPNGLTLTGNADVTNSAAIYYATKSVRIPSGNVVSYTQNIQLRIRGTFTIEGDLDGSGAGLAGVADTYSVASFPSSFGTPIVADVTLQQGTPGYFGVTHANGGILERVSQRSGSSSKYRARIQSLDPPLTVGQVEAIPSLNLNWDGTTLSGLPTDLRGTSGGPGGIRYWEDFADVFSEFNRGGTGGAGGAGLLIISRGMSFGASGRIISSGDAGSAGVRDAGDERPAWSGSGAGGAPGATIIVLDGATVSSPVLTDGNIIADYGASPPPGDPSNQLPEAYIHREETRFNVPTVDQAHIRENRSSYYVSRTSGLQAGIAAARYFFLLPDVTPEDDTEDVTLANAQSITLGVTEAFGNRLDPSITSLIATITQVSVTNAYSHANIYVQGNSAGAQYPAPLFVGPAEPSLEFDLPADGETYDVIARPVLINGIESTDQEVSTQVISSGAAFSETVRNLGSNGPNILSDPNFLLTASEGAFGRYWEVVAGDNWAINLTGAEDGGPCIQLNGDGTGNNHLRAPYRIPVDAGATLYLRGRIYRDAATAVGSSTDFRIEISEYDGDGNLLSSYPDLVNVGALATGWQTVTAEVTPLNANCRQVEFWLLGTAGMTAGFLRFSQLELSRAALDATVGATAGTDLRDSSGAILDDIDVSNDYLVEEWTGGSVIRNGSFRQAVVRAGYEVPSSWYRRKNGGPDFDQSFYYLDATRDILVLDASVEGHTVVLQSEAFRVNPGVQYEVILRHRRTAGTGGLDVRVESIAEDMPADKRSLIGTSTGDMDSELATPSDISGTMTTDVLSDLLSNTAWTVTALTWTPPPDAEWASLRLTPDLTGDTVQLDYAFIREKSTDGRSNNYESQEAFRSEDWGDNDLRRWYGSVTRDYTPGSDPGISNMSIVATGAAGAGVGAYALRIGNNAGNDMYWGALCGMRQAVPVAVGKLYRMTLIIARQAGTGTYYAGPFGLKGDVRNGAGTLVNASGAASFSGQHYFSASNRTPSGWERRDVYFTKDGVAYNGTAAGTISDPKVLHPDVEYVVPGVITSYSSAVGIWDINYVEIAEVSGADYGALTELNNVDEDTILQGSVGQVLHAAGGGTSVSTATIITVVTSGYLTVSGGKAVIIVSAEVGTSGAPGSSSHDDGAARFYLDVDVAGSWVNVNSFIVGARNDGTSDVNWYIPFTMQHGATGIATQVRARLRAQAYDIGNGLKTSVISNPNITIIGTKR